MNPCLQLAAAQFTIHQTTIEPLSTLKWSTASIHSDTRGSSFKKQKTAYEGLPRLSHALYSGGAQGSGVWATYNEGSKLIMTVTKSASKMRGSEFFEHKRLFLGYHPMGLSKDAAC